MTLRNIPVQSNLPFNGVILPSISIAKEDKDKIRVNPECSNLEFITQLCREGFKTKVMPRIPKDRIKEYADRVKFELDTIEQLGFSDYLLMVWDICCFADRAGIPRGPGRGSVSSSIVSYLIGITELDPIENGLFFARFLSKARVKDTIIDGVRYIDGGSCPDIDMDFCHFRRSEIFDYIRGRYPGQTAYTLTVGTLTAKSLMMDVVKVFEGGSVEDAKFVSDMIERDAGQLEEIEDMISDDPDKQNVRFKEWSDSHKDAVEIAMGLSGLNRSEGKHASSFLICYKKISDVIPLQSALDEDTGERYMVSGYDMYSAQEVILKFDLLGLKALSVTKAACDKLGITPQSINVYDPSIYSEFQSFKNRYGIFQLESFAQGMAVARVKPRDFDQLSACLAISRPGASAFLQNYVDYVNEGKFESIHPIIDDILKPTGGVCVFQEQLLAMLVRVGMTPEDADVIRKMVGKKQREKIGEAKEQIEQVCKANDRPVEIAELLVRIATDSAKYQFARAHSSAYTIITGRTLYLKIHHPIEFWWATLQMNSHEAKKYEKMMIIEREMRVMGYQLLPPDLGKSEIGFKIESPTSVRFGLGMIRGVSGKTESKMLAFQGEVIKTKFKTFEAMKAAGLGIGVASALIQAGCLGAIGGDISRSRLALECQTFNLLTDKEKALCITLADKPEVNHDVLKAIVYLRDNKDEKGKPLFSRATRFSTIKKKYEKYKEIWEMNRRNEKLANYFYERTILGFSYSHSLREIFGEEVDGLMSVADTEAAKTDEKVRLIGFVKEPIKSKSKAGNDMFRFTLTDETGEISIRFFNKTIDQIKEANGRLPEDGDIIITKATKKDGSCCFTNELSIVTAVIYMKLSELKEAGEKAETGLATSPTETTSAPAA